MANFLKIIGFLLHFLLTMEFLALRILHFDPIFPLLKYHIERIAKAMVYMLLVDSMLFATLYALAPVSTTAAALIGLVFVAEGFLAMHLWYQLQYAVSVRIHWETEQQTGKRRTQIRQNKAK